MNPFLPLIKQIMKGMDLKPQIAKRDYEILADKILNRIWQDINSKQQIEYEMFYPAIQNTLWDICKDDKRLLFIAHEIEIYLRNKIKKEENYHVNNGDEDRYCSEHNGL